MGIPRYLENGEELNSSNISNNKKYEDKLFEYFEKNVYNQSEKYGYHLFVRVFEELYENNIFTYSQKDFLNNIRNPRINKFYVILDYIVKRIRGAISKSAGEIKDSTFLNNLSKTIVFMYWLNDTYPRSVYDVAKDNVLLIDRREESEYSLISLIIEFILSIYGLDILHDIADILLAIERGDTSDVFWTAAFMFPIVGVLKVSKNVDKLEYADELAEAISDISKLTNEIADGISDTSKHFDEVGEVVDEIEFDDIYAETKTTSNGNKKIIKLLPNMTYKTGEFGDHIYKTDELGRIVEVEVEKLQLSKKPREPHNGKTPGKVEGDHAGHLIADIFGGSKDLDNLVSMLSSLNQGTYRKMEKEWANVLKAKGVVSDIKIKVNYDGEGLRPISFEVKYKIDGVISNQIFSNLK